VQANEIASYVNKIYTLLVEIQDDKEPVFTGNDLIAYETSKGLAKSGGFPSLGTVAPVATTARSSHHSAGLGQSCSFLDVAELEAQRPRLLRLFENTSPSSEAPSRDPFEVDQLHEPLSPLRAPARVGSAESRPVSPAATTLSAAAGLPRPVHGPLIPMPALDPRAAQKRVVWVRRCPLYAKLGEISKLIREGPVHSIIFRSDPRAALAREARIVFHLATDAARFLERMQGLDDNTWLRELRFELGEPFPDDEEMQLMGPPTNARRRLTIVRAGLFTHTSTKTMFANDVYTNVRRSSVELVFFYNSGNATVVLDTVNRAIRLKEWFDNKSTTIGSPYEGVKATFSKDPCEHSMRLVSSTSHERQLRLQQRAETRSGRRR
jgi:hypothetical protein